MARLRFTKSDVAGICNRIIFAIASLFKSKPRRRPNFNTSPEGIDSIELQDWGTPSLPPSIPPTRPPSPLPPTRPPTPPISEIAPPEQPAGFELTPPGPENIPWLESPDLQNTDEYDELMFNPWNYLRRRSSIIPPPPPSLPPSIFRIPAVLTYTPVLDPGAQLPGGEFASPYTQAFMPAISIFLVAVFLSVTALWATANFKRKLRHRFTRHPLV